MCFDDVSRPVPGGLAGGVTTGGKQRLVVTPVLQAGILDPHPGKVADDDLEEVIPVIQVPVPVVSEATSDSERRNSL